MHVKIKCGVSWIFLFLLGLGPISSVSTIEIQENVCPALLLMDIKTTTEMTSVSLTPTRQDEPEPKPDPGPEQEPDPEDQNRSGAEPSLTIRIKFTIFIVSGITSFLIVGFCRALYANRRMILLLTRTAFCGSAQRRSRDRTSRESQQRNKTPSQTEKGIDEMEEKSEIGITEITPTPIPTMVSFVNILPEEESEYELERIHRILETLEQPCTSTTARQLWEEISLSPPIPVLYL